MENDNNKNLSADNMLFPYPYNAQHIGSRAEQQDSFAFSDMMNIEETLKYGAIALLADGMGGLKNGKQASECAVKSFMECYKSSFDGDVYRALLKAAYYANDCVLEYDGAGSTLCAVVVKDKKLYYVSIGDSRIYLYRNRQLHQLNCEHNYAVDLDQMVKEGKKTYQEAMSDPRRQALTSYMGISELELIDRGPDDFELFIGDSLLLCSDGLYRGVSAEEMVYILENSKESVADDLINCALRKRIHGQDNVTVVLVDLD